MNLFATATLTPAALLALGAAAGGPFPVLALLSMTLLIATLDRLLPYAAATEGASEFPAATPLSVTLAVIHFGLLALVIRALANPGLAAANKLTLLIAAALFFGQVSNSNAHELIHRPARGLRSLGTWVYVSLLFGHHASAHPLVHHVHVATRADPNTARPGESSYRFLWRAWRGSFREGLRAETARRARGRARGLHPYVVYIAGALALLALTTVVFGPRGLVAHLALAGLAQSQLLLSDYVQHYGLVRTERPGGGAEPVAPRHSWNAPHRLSAALMLNAPRHSDHHAHPARNYPHLRLDPGLPILPMSLPAMATLALWPPLWRRIMDPRAKAERERTVSPSRSPNPETPP